MQVAKNIFLAIHVLSVVAMLVLLLIQTPKPEKRLPKGFMHSSLTALVAGFALVLIISGLSEKLNHMVVGIKFLVLMVILILGYQNQKKEKMPNLVWASMLGLTIFNIFIAFSVSNAA